MANDLIVAEQDALAVISSPALQRLQRLSLGTVQWPDQPTRRYLSGGLTLRDSERATAEHLLGKLRIAACGAPGVETAQARLALLTKMLLVYPSAGNSEASGQARAEAYLDTLGDIAPWAIDRALRKWNRGECGDQHDYRWAPAPAVLLASCRLVIWQYTRAMEHLEGLLNATTLERAMDSRPIEREGETVLPMMRKL
jgi:hypothetical protein